MNVLAVVVVHERDLSSIEPWPALHDMLAHSDGVLRLSSVLLYDNSAAPRLSSSELPHWARYIHDPSNGGTVAAYTCALQIAESCRQDWVLLLDQDTRLPPDLLSQAQEALAAVDVPIAAVLPTVYHGSTTISPAHVTWMGSIRPIHKGKSLRARRLTGIASGALISAKAMKPLFPLPVSLWLDYVDHWIFARLRDQGHRIAVSAACLHHELSIARPDQLSAGRLESILDGEKIFLRTLGWPARTSLPVRLLLRGWRLRSARPDLARRLFARATCFRCGWDGFRDSQREIGKWGAEDER